MLNLVEVHEQLYNLLINWRRRSSDFQFTFRKSNHANRLEEGYWFYGNDDYLAVSFWNGMDWKNRTPNIAYIITKDAKSYLEVNVSDSEYKRSFAEDYLVRHLNLETLGKKYLKSYETDENNYLEGIEHFILHDKQVIDTFVTSDSVLDFFNKENPIAKISSTEFQKWHTKIKKYRKAKQEQEIEEDFYIGEDKPSKLLSIEINDYGRIDYLKLNRISQKNQWVFITGENGSGKTNLLRAIGSLLGNRMLSKVETIENPNFKITAELLFKNDLQIINRAGNDIASGKKRPITQGLAMYGPYRLDTTIDKISKINFYKELNKDQSFKSLFKTGAHLLSIDKQFELWKKDVTKERNIFEKRKYYFKSVLTDIVPNLCDIQFKNDERNLSTIYEFLDNESSERHSMLWKDLSSGTKSTIALIGDIMIRFYNQQKFIYDPSEFRGVVLIDEIDLHLHPSGQRDIVVNLSKTFPNIQFIVTTHSPIPLLGANSDSVFLNVKRSSNQITVERLEFIEKYIKELLPNQLYTSDLFGLETLTSVQNKNKTHVFTGSTITEVFEEIDLKSRNIIRDPENSAFLEKVKLRLSEKGK